MLGVLGGCEEAKAGQAWRAGPVSWGTGLQRVSPHSHAIQPLASR